MDAFTPFPTQRPAPEGQVYVHPGRTTVSKEAAPLPTIVGSGVAVCLWDPLHGVGGMAHFLLPEAGSAPAASRYGDVAMRTLVDELAKAGANTATLRARFYGGSAPPIGSASGHIGDRNVAAAVSFLRARAILIVDRDIGGDGGRKVLFSPRDGSVEVVRIRHGQS